MVLEVSALRHGPRCSPSRTSWASKPGLGPMAAAGGQRCEMASGNDQQPLAAVAPHERDDVAGMRTSHRDGFITAVTEQDWGAPGEAAEACA